MTIPTGDSTQEPRRAETPNPPAPVEKKTTSKREEINRRRRVFYPSPLNETFFPRRDEWVFPMKLTVEVQQGRAFPPKLDAALGETYQKPLVFLLGSPRSQSDGEISILNGRH